MSSVGRPAGGNRASAFTGEVYENEILFPRCTKDRILRIEDYRNQGLTWDVIATLVGSNATTVNRWYRGLKSYGIGAFAHDG